MAGIVELVVDDLPKVTPVQVARGPVRMPFAELHANFYPEPVSQKSSFVVVLNLPTMFGAELALGAGIAGRGP